MARKDMQGQLLAGIFIIIIGILFLLRNFDIIPNDVDFSNLWPLALIAVGLWFMFVKKD
jgi:hypothetical protein